MKKTHGVMIPVLVVLIITFVGLWSCSKDVEEIVTNEDPSCQITNPADGQQITQGELVTITAAATDTDGSIVNVNFFIDDVFVNSDDSAPYTYDWDTNNEAAGQYKIEAQSDDGIGLSDRSEVRVEIISN